MIWGSVKLPSFTSLSGEEIQTDMESLLNPSTVGYQNANSTDMQFMDSQASGTYMSAIGQLSLPPRQTVIEDSSQLTRREGGTIR